MPQILDSVKKCLIALSVGFSDGETFPCFAQERVELEENKLAKRS